MALESQGLHYLLLFLDSTFKSPKTAQSQEQRWPNCCDSVELKRWCSKSIGHKNKQEMKGWAVNRHIHSMLQKQVITQDTM